MARTRPKAGDTARIARCVGRRDGFDDALALYAKTYADQVEPDFAAFQTSTRSGRPGTDEAAALELSL